MLVGTLKPKAEPRNLGEYPVLPLSGEWTTKGGLGESGSEDTFRQNGHSDEHVHIIHMCCEAPYVHVSCCVGKGSCTKLGLREGLGPIQKVPNFLSSVTTQSRLKG